MAGMTGLGLGFVLYVLFVLPLILFPAAVAGIVVADWLRRRDWLLLGSFLTGAGGLWAVMSGWALVNDLTDAAVSYPGWTPIPLAMGAAATIVGAATRCGQLWPHDQAIRLTPMSTPGCAEPVIALITPGRCRWRWSVEVASTVPVASLRPSTTDDRTRQPYAPCSSWRAYSAWS